MKRLTAVLMSVALASCNIPGELSPDQQQSLASALATTCPFVQALKPLVQGNSGALTAWWVMEQYCPPNAPPTHVAQVLATIAAAVTLRPYIQRAHLSHAN